MQVSFNKISSIINYTSKVTQKPVFCGSDTFQKQDKKEVYLAKLNQLFPNGSLDTLYNNINKDFGIDKPPALKFIGDNDGVTAGGFTFEKNTIDMSLSDLLESDTKLVGIKDGKRTVLISPSVKLPLFTTKEGADKFIEQNAKTGNFGFDEIIAEPVTPDEQRKFIIQKISHEVIHAQQHMVMRQTEGISEKDIIRAWTHFKPKNLIEEKQLESHVNKLYENSYWAKQLDTEKKYQKNSPAGFVAYKWLEGVRNYPRVDSPEYLKNPLESDAYNRSFQYAYKKCGPWV